MVEKLTKKKLWAGTIRAKPHFFSWNIKNAQQKHKKLQGWKCIFSSGLYRALTLCSERNERLDGWKGSVVENIIAIHLKDAAADIITA